MRLLFLAGLVGVGRAYEKEGGDETVGRALKGIGGGGPSSAFARVSSFSADASCARLCGAPSALLLDGSCTLGVEGARDATAAADSKEAPRLRTTFASRG